MISYKDTYEGRLPYFLGGYNAENHSRRSSNTAYSDIRKSISGLTACVKHFREKLIN